MMLHEKRTSSKKLLPLTALLLALGVLSAGLTQFPKRLPGSRNNGLDTSGPLVHELREPKEAELLEISAEDEGEEAEEEEGQEGHEEQELREQVEASRRRRRSSRRRKPSGSSSTQPLQEKLNNLTQAVAQIEAMDKAEWEAESAHLAEADVRLTHLESSNAKNAEEHEALVKEVAELVKEFESHDHEHQQIAGYLQEFPGGGYEENLKAAATGAEVLGSFR